MPEVARVVSLSKNMAKVQIIGEESCGSECGSCHGCPDKAESYVEVENKAGAKVGQRVRIERNSQAVYNAAGLVFGLPMVMLFIGVVLGYKISEVLQITKLKEMLGAISGITFWLISYLVIKLIDKKFNFSGKIAYKILDVI